MQNYEIYDKTVHQETGLGVFLNKSDGAGWTPVNSGLPRDPYVCCLAAEGPNLYAGLEWPAVGRGKVLLSWASGLGLYISTDHGASWKAAGSGLPSKAWVQYLLSSGAALFAATSRKGVFISKNNGKSWRALNGGLPHEASAGHFLVSGSNLFAAIGGRGIWRLPLSALKLNKR
jgi:hypothetical protein